MTARTEIDSILQRGADGGRITPDEALLLYTDAPFHALGEAADAVRRSRFAGGARTGCLYPYWRRGGALAAPEPPPVLAVERGQCLADARAP